MTATNSRQPIKIPPTPATSTLSPQPFDTATIMGQLYGPGITGLKGAFDRDWIAQMGAEIGALYSKAL